MKFLLCLVTLGVLLAASGAAQETTGVSGSPSSTTTIKGTQLPPPDPPFRGVIKPNAAESKSWWAPRPNRIQDAGGIRNQFHHVVDIAPTLLEVTGIKMPATVDGLRQKPMEGTSLAYTFAKANAAAPTRHHTQYFEMMGVRGLYHDGWYACTTPLRPAWVTSGAVVENPSTAFQWELYDTRKDWTQFENVASKHPQKLKELQVLFAREARRSQVYPLDASVVQRLAAPRPNITAGRSEFVYTRPMTGLPLGDAPSLLNSSYTLTADIDVPAAGAEGMLVTSGGRFGGYGFYLQSSKPVFVWNLVDVARVRWEGPTLAPGRHTVEFSFTYDGAGPGTLAFNSLAGIGKGGTGVLSVDGQVVSTQKMEHTLPLILQWDESFDVGSDTGTPVDESYQCPFPLSAQLHSLKLRVKTPQLSPADAQRLREAERNNRTSE